MGVFGLFDPRKLSLQADGSKTDIYYRYSSSRQFFIGIPIHDRELLVLAIGLDVFALAMCL